MKRLLTAINAFSKAWTHPEAVVCIKVRAIRDGDAVDLYGGKALAYLGERLNLLEESSAHVPELVGAAYSEAYKTAVQDWGEGQFIPAQREQEYLDRNLAFIEERMEDPDRG